MRQWIQMTNELFPHKERKTNKNGEGGAKGKSDSKRPAFLVFYFLRCVIRALSVSSKGQAHRVSDACVRMFLTHESFGAT